MNIYENTKIHLPVEYVAVKSAIIQLTKYFAQLYKNDGIRMNCISPGGILDSQDEVCKIIFQVRRTKRYA